MRPYAIVGSNLSLGAELWGCAAGLSQWETQPRGSARCMQFPLSTQMQMHLLCSLQFVASAERGKAVPAQLWWEARGSQCFSGGCCTSKAQRCVPIAWGCSGPRLGGSCCVSSHSGETSRAEQWLPAGVSPTASTQPLLLRASPTAQRPRNPPRTAAFLSLPHLQAPSCAIWRTLPLLCQVFWVCCMARLHCALHTIPCPNAAPCLSCTTKKCPPIEAASP